MSTNFDDLATALAPGFAARHAQADGQRDAAPDVEIVAVVGFTIHDDDSERVVQAGERLTMNAFDADHAHAGRVRRANAAALQ